MVTATKSPAPVPLQAVVGVICDALADLQLDDQARALEAARITLGVVTSVVTSALVEFAPLTASDPASGEARMELVAEFCRSLRSDQMGVLTQTLDMTQKLLLMEILRFVNPPEQGG